MKILYLLFFIKFKYVYLNYTKFSKDIHIQICIFKLYKIFKRYTYIQLYKNFKRYTYSNMYI